MAKTPHFFQRFFKPKPTQKRAGFQESLAELTLAAGALAAQLRHGQHNNHRAGDGLDFWQFRPHQPLEPAATIDWKQSARSPQDDQLWVREREQKVPRSLYLWVDSSPSMHWRSQESLPTKYEAALTSALALGQAALLGGEQVGVIGSKHRYTGRHSLPRLAYALTQTTSTLPDFTAIPPRAALLLVSDFLWDDTAMSTCLAQLALHPGRIALLATLDPQEHDLPFTGHTRFTSCEAEPDLTLPATESLHTAYRTHLTEHFAKLTHSAHRTAPFFKLYATHHDTRPMLTACHHYLEGRV